MSAEPSPAAQAVLTAVTLKRYDVPPEGLPAFAEEMAPLIAAALRAAANGLIPRLPGDTAFQRGYLAGIDNAKHQLRAIAAELEASNA